MVTSMLQSCMSSTPFRLMLNPLILMSLEVGLDVRTPAEAHHICVRCFCLCDYHSEGAQMTFVS